MSIHIDAMPSEDVITKKLGCATICIARVT